MNKSERRSEKSSGGCFLCQKVGSATTLEHSTSFKTLMNYLGIDILHWLSADQNCGVHLIDESGSGPVSVALCDRCAWRMEEFLKLYQEFETARLYLEDCVQGLYHLLGEREGLLSQVKMEDKEVNSFDESSHDLIESLREETRNKCALKVSNSLRIKDELDNEEKCEVVEEEVLSQEFQEEPIIPGDIEDRLGCDGDNSDPLTLDMGELRSLFGNESTYDLPSDEVIKQASTGGTGVTCDYCEHSSRDRYTVRCHMLLMHTLQIFTDKVPPGTTQPQLHQAILSTVDKHLQGRTTLDNLEKPKKICCITCSKLFSQRGPFKIHLLECHFEEIINCLQDVSPQDGSGLETASSSTEAMESNQIVSEDLIFFKPDLFDFISEHDTPNEVQRIETVVGGVDEGDVDPEQLMFVENGDTSTFNGDPLSVNNEAIKSPPPAKLVDGKSHKKPKRRFKCTTCGKKFISKDGLRKHSKTHEEPSKSSGVACDHCGHSSRDRYTLRRHMLLMHTLQIYADQLPPGTTQPQLHQATTATVENHLKHSSNWRQVGSISCASCSKRFSQRTIFRIHLLESHFTEVVGILRGQLGLEDSSPDEDSSVKMELLSSPEEGEDTTLEYQQADLSYNFDDKISIPTLCLVGSPPDSSSPTGSFFDGPGIKN